MRFFVFEISPLNESFAGKCVSPAFAMPLRGMASLASVGLAGKPWRSASLARLNTLPAFATYTKRRRVETRHAKTTSRQGLHEMEQRGVEGERRNPRRRFLSGDEAQALSILVDMRSKSEEIRGEKGLSPAPILLIILSCEKHFLISSPR